MSTVKNEKNVCILVYALRRRGMQLWNPFHSIWSTRAGRYASLTFLVLAGVSCFIYLTCLIVIVVRIFWNIRTKQSELSAMRRIRRLMYQVGSHDAKSMPLAMFTFCKGAFYRFQFLLLATIFCAIMTLIWFYLSQIYETEWVWDTEHRPKIHYSGAFITGAEREGVRHL